MGRLKSDLQNLIYGRKVKTPMQPGELKAFEDSVYFYTSADSGNLNWRAVLGITDKRVILEPTTRRSEKLVVTYADVAAVEAGVYKGISLPADKPVINLTLKDGRVYSLYATSQYKSDTRNMLGILKLSLRAAQDAEN